MAIFFLLFILLSEVTGTRRYGGSTGTAPPQSSDGVSRQGLRLLDANDTALLLLDHQSGLLQTVKDVPISEVRTNVVVLAKLAMLAGLPIISTASEPKGPNGPIILEIEQNANVTYVPRRGEISAWENPDFVAAVRATGKKTLVMAGIWTSVCVTFPAIQALAEGFTVYAVIDASGDPSDIASHVTQVRMAQAGVILVTTNAVVAEIQRTWNRPDAAAYADLYALFNPNYAALIESYTAAQAAVTSARR